MSSDRSILLPIDTWSYSGPMLRYRGIDLDIGAFAESLIFYDKIYVYFSSYKQWHRFVSYFNGQNQFDRLLELLSNNIIGIFFQMYGPIPADDTSGSSQFGIELGEQSLIPNFLSNEQKSDLLYAIGENVIEYDLRDSIDIYTELCEELFESNTMLALQLLLDEIYLKLGLGESPKMFNGKVELEEGDKLKATITLDEISNILGSSFTPHSLQPIVGLLECNKLLIQASHYGFDLVCNSPMSSLIGNKIYNIVQQAPTKDMSLNRHCYESKFPDIGKLVNQDLLSLDDILRIRKKTKKIRKILNNNCNQSFELCLEYLDKIAIETDLHSFGGHQFNFLRLFSHFGGDKPNSVDPNTSETEIAKCSTDFLINSIHRGWSPIIWGHWDDSYIRQGNS